MSLGAHLEDTRVAHHQLKQQELQQESGGDIVLLFSLPNGEQARVGFKMGHTIAYVKLELQKLHGYPMDKQTLRVQGRALIDPLSIADYPSLSTGSGVPVEVTTSE